MEHDSISDEAKPYTIDEFVSILKADLDKYAADSRESNDFNKSRHTFDEWMRAFGNYLSF